MQNELPRDFGKYRLMKRIGKGGMAEVFLARQRGSHLLVAVKVMLSDLEGKTEFVEMFSSEGRLAMQLQHSAIVKTYEVGRVRGSHFICMEHIAGLDLSKILKYCAQTRRRIPVPHVLHIAMRACEGLEHAHSLKDGSGTLLKLVNRDVSPSNIRISFDGEVKLFDFGIAKASSNLSSEIGTLKGKMSYMSPEQVRGLPLDRRSDLFALGIVLHEMLTRERLFRGDSSFQIMDQVREAAVAAPSEHNARVPREVDDIVLRALERDQNARFQTGAEMASALRGALNRYGFSQTELADFVRDVVPEAWKRERALREGPSEEVLSLSGAPQSAEEDYGVMMVSVDADPTAPLPAINDVHAGPRVPRWMYGLLGAAVLLLTLAGVLLLLAA